MQSTLSEQKEIGRGPHAVVYRGRDDVLGRDMAVKVLREWEQRPAAAVARCRFAQARAALRHPHLADAWVVESAGGKLATEFYAAGSLADRIRQDSPLSPLEIRPLLLGLLQALEYLHEQGVLHGAIKPSNLFVDEQGRVRLADGVGLPAASERRVTYPQPLAPADEKYLAPEWATGQVGEPADLYALGLTMLELLLGNEFELLFPEVLGGRMSWAEWHQGERQIPPVETLVAGLPRDVARLLNRLLRKDLKERCRTATEALEGLRRPSKGYRRWGGPLLLALGAAGVLAAAALLVLRPWEWTDADASSKTELRRQRPQRTLSQKQLQALLESTRSEWQAKVSKAEAERKQRDADWQQKLNDTRTLALQFAAQRDELQEMVDTLTRERDRLLRDRRAMRAKL